VRPHSRGAMRPSFASIFAPEGRGRREDRVRAAPAVSRAIVIGKNAHEHTGSAEAIRPSLRNGFTAYSALSPVSRALLPPSLRRSSPQSLAPASGARTTRLHRPLESRSSIATFASTASHRTFVTTRDPPLSSGETGGFVEMICPTGIADYFASEDWTGQITLESFGKLLSSRIEKSMGNDLVVGHLEFIQRC
jgi:hypothetical protein